MAQPSRLVSVSDSIALFVHGNSPPHKESKSDYNREGGGLHRCKSPASTAPVLSDGRPCATPRLVEINLNDERLKLMDFSDPLLASQFVIFTTASRLGVASLDDLRVGVERSSALTCGRKRTMAGPGPSVTSAGDNRIFIKL